MAQKTLITAGALAALPEGGEIRDTRQPGFFARKYKSGRISFYVKGDARHDGIKQTLTRKLDADTPAQARIAAEKLLPLIRTGELLRQQLANDATFQAEKERRRLDAATKQEHRWKMRRWRLENVLADYLVYAELRDSTRAQYQRFMRDYFDDWLVVPLPELTREQLRGRYRELQQRGQATAAASFRYFFALYRFAYAEGCELDPSLAKCLPKGWNKARRRPLALRIEHIAPLWHVFTELDHMRTGEPQATGDLFRYLLLTGARFSEAANLQWRDVNLKRRTITQQVTKTTDESDPHLLYIGDYLLTLLQRRKDSGDPLPFMNYRTRRQFDVGKVSSTTKKICTRLEALTDEPVGFSPHQLRKLVSNIIGGRLAIPAKHAQWILNRAGISVDEQFYYSRSDVAELAPSMQALENFILSHVTDKE